MSSVTTRVPDSPQFNVIEERRKILATRIDLIPVYAKFILHLLFQQNPLEGETLTTAEKLAAAMGTQDQTVEQSLGFLERQKLISIRRARHLQQLWIIVNWSAIKNLIVEEPRRVMDGEE